MILEAIVLGVATAGIMIAKDVVKKIDRIENHTEEYEKSVMRKHADEKIGK